MNKQELISKIKSLQDISSEEKAYLIELVNTKKKYGLVWEEKPEDVEEQLRSMLPVFKEIKERAIISEDKDAPNHILIEGDNLHALTALTYTHEGKIDVIYIDPPYNTGNKDKDGTTDFKYNDDYVDINDTYRHSKWLSFMDKRLRLAKKLLNNEGFIAISIDDNEIHQLKLLCDEIFNENVKTICVKMSEASGLKMASVKKLGTIPKYKEYILFIKPSGIYNLFFDNIPKESWDSEYNIYLENFDKSIKYKIDELNETNLTSDEDIIKMDELISSVTLKSVSEKLRELNITSKVEKEKWCFENSWRICQCASSTSVLSLANIKREYNQQKLFFLKSSRDNKLYLVRSEYNLNSAKPRVQMIFAEDNLTVHPGDFWSDIKTTGIDAEGKIKFKNGKKPLRLLNRILKSNNNPNSIILDFFAGSGSTMHSVFELNKEDNGNRQCILVTNNENNICETITYKRLLNALEGNPKNTLRYFQADFVPSERTEINRRLLTARSTELLCIKEDCFLDVTKDYNIKERQAKLFTNGLGKYMIVIYHSRNQEEVIAQLTELIQNLETTEKIKLYAFSPEKESIEEDFFAVADKIAAVPLPDSIYNAYRATFRTLKLNNKPAAVNSLNQDI